MESKREEENVGMEASFRVCKVVPPIQLCKPIVSLSNYLSLCVEERKRVRELKTSNLLGPIIHKFIFITLFVEVAISIKNGENG